MNQDIFQGKWKKIKGRIKEEWAGLTDDDLDKVEGKAEQLVGVLQEKFGYTKEKANESLQDFLKKISKELDINPYTFTDISKKYLNFLEQEIKNNPIQSIVLSFTIGFIVDRLFRKL